MSHFQSYSYVSSNINGKQNELFLQQVKNEKEDKKNFVAKKSNNGKNIKTLRGKSQNDEKWTIQQDEQKVTLDKPFQDFENWFIGSMPNMPNLPNLASLPSLLEQQQSNALITYNTSSNPFDHDFFRN